MDNPFIIGKSVYLRSLTLDDVDNDYYEWFNDKDTSKGNAHGIIPETKDRAIAFYNDLQNNKNIVHFAIVDIKTNQHIGCCSLQSINWVYRSAEMARIIGEKKFRGKGIGTEVGKLLLEYAFNTLNLHKIWLGNIALNEAALKSKSNLNFKTDGVLRDAVFKNGRYYDVVISSILKHEYTKQGEK